MFPYETFASVSGLDSTLCAADVAFRELAVEELEHHSVDDARRSGIVTVTFVTHEGVCAIKFVPAEVYICISQCVINARPTLARNMRILPAKGHQQLAFNLGNPVERVVAHAFAETSLVDVGRITTRRSKHLGIHRRSKSEVPADAEPHNTKLAGALRMRSQVVESDARIGIVTRQFLGDLIGVAAF